MPHTQTNQKIAQALAPVIRSEGNHVNHADLILLEIGGYSADMFTMMIQEKNILRLVNIRISGRGDKDCAAIARYRGEDLSE